MSRTDTPCLSPGVRSGLAFALLLFVSAGALRSVSAQELETVREENFRGEPNGVVLATLNPGVTLRFVEEAGSWSRATLEGWVWMQSLQAIERDGFTLIVSAEGGENLRARPSGRILGRISEGTLFQELERIPGWIRVRRTGWIWNDSVEETSIESEAAESETPARPAPSTSSGVGTASGRDAAPSVSTEGWRRVGPTGLPLLSGPDGDTLARMLPETDVRILARQGNWARVSIEGWSWIPEGDPDAPVDSAAVLVDLSAEDLSGRPEFYRGRTVRMELQFISLEEAERVRTDFYEGEPFLLTRDLEGEGRFIYVAVPADRLAEFQDLAPLERISVLGRVRTGAATLTGSPVLDLLDYGRAR